MTRKKAVTVYKRPWPTILLVLAFGANMWALGKAGIHPWVSGAAALISLAMFLHSTHENTESYKAMWHHITKSIEKERHWNI